MSLQDEKYQLQLLYHMAEGLNNLACSNTFEDSELYLEMILFFPIPKKDIEIYGSYK